jgi:predicted DNA-binding mobile mystery protein A
LGRKTSPKPIIAQRGPGRKRAELAGTARTFPRVKSGQLPRTGWVRAIRESLGMSQSQLAARAGIPRSTVQQMERAEGRRRITLGSLDRLADAMGCQVAFAIIPRTGSLEDLRRRQALARAEALLAAREDPSPGHARRRERVAARLLRGSPRKLWRS